MSRVMNAVVVLAVMLGSFAATALAEEALPQKDAQELSPSEVAVRKIVDQHIAGIVAADAKQIEAAWDTKAGRITSVSRDKESKEIVTSGPIGESIKLWSQKKLSGTAGEILSVDVVNDRMALVKAKITWNRQVFDDYLVLLATDGEWKLVSKTYTAKNARLSGGYGVSRAE